VIRETRYRQPYPGEDRPRDEQDERAPQQETTTYYLVPPAGQARQAAPAPRPPQERARENPVEPKKQPPAKKNAAPPQFTRPLPGLAKTGNLLRLASFVMFVILPTIFAFIYYSAVAAPQYVSEFRFSVKDSSTSMNMGGMTNMLSASGLPAGGAVVENFLVVDYLSSRQAVDDLQKQIPLIEMYSRPEIDSWSRFDRSLPVEGFVLYWQKMIRAHYDQITGIASAQIRAFTPQDSEAIAKALVALSEDLVNKIANRTRVDEVEKAQERVRRVRAQLVERTAGIAQPQPVSPQAGANAALLLDLERQTAQNMLASAMQTLDQARVQAVSQHLYITPYIRPSLPQSSSYPKPYLWTMIVALVAFGIWLVGLLTLRAIFDH
jgi:capsular polysaccharide transport system permease protein